VPLEVTDPEDEVRDDCGARVEFKPEELVGIYGEAGMFEGLLGLSKGIEGFEDFAFESLHVFESDVKEVSGAAGGVEDAGVAELFVEGAGGFDCGGSVAGVDVLGDDGEGIAPVVAEGLDEGGDNEALDVGAGSVVGSEGMALVGVEGAFQEGSEDGGFYVAPAGVGGFDQEVELIEREGQGGGGFEEAAVELEDVAAEDGGEATFVHGLPESLGHIGEVDYFVPQAFEEVEPTALGKETHVFGEGGEDASREEFGDLFWGVLEFEVTGEYGEFGCDFAGDFRGDSRGVEGERVEPDSA
jgi:hypothetical protein